jgi:transposase
MTRLYARSAGGARICETTPGGRWKIMTILGAMSLRGIIASMTIEEATDGDIFLAYVEHILCAALKPGDVVAMDNLSSHKIKGVQRLIQKAGAEVLYLPPYSPDLNPIEKAWSKLKQILRSAKARTKEALEVAIAEAIRTITPYNARAWFNHCIDGLQQFLKCSNGATTQVERSASCSRSWFSWPSKAMMTLVPLENLRASLAGTRQISFEPTVLAIKKEPLTPISDSPFNNSFTWNNIGKVSPSSAAL